MMNDTCYIYADEGILGELKYILINKEVMHRMISPNTYIRRYQTFHAQPLFF